MTHLSYTITFSAPISHTPKSQGSSQHKIMETFECSEHRNIKMPYCQHNEQIIFDGVLWYRGSGNALKRNLQY